MSKVRGKDPGPRPAPTLGRNDLVARVRALMEIPQPKGEEAKAL